MRLKLPPDARPGNLARASAGRMYFDFNPQIVLVAVLDFLRVRRIRRLKLFVRSFLPLQPSVSQRPSKIENEDEDEDEDDWGMGATPEALHCRKAMSREQVVASSRNMGHIEAARQGGSCSLLGEIPSQIVLVLVLDFLRVRRIRPPETLRSRVSFRWQPSITSDDQKTRTRTRTRTIGVCIVS
jgi:hypothetical protein